MPQEIRVLKCFKCDIFQGDIVKKAKLWNCKICGEKQTVMQEFGRGNGKECRLHIQKLNMKIGNVEDAFANKLLNDADDYYEPIAENVENLSKEQLMLPLLGNINLSHNTENKHDFDGIVCNPNTNDSKNINYSNDDDVLLIEPSQSNTTNTLYKYSNCDRNLKRNSRERTDILSKKTKWNNYITENDE